MYNREQRIQHNMRNHEYHGIRINKKQMRREEQHATIQIDQEYVREFCERMQGKDSKFVRKTGRNLIPECSSAWKEGATHAAKGDLVPKIINSWK